MTNRRRVVGVGLILAIFALSPGACGKETAKGKYRFGPHPRLKYIVAEISRQSDAGKQAIVSGAEAILKSPAEIPTVGGQWIFYYACPTHNRSLSFKDGKHVCPQCGKEYTDERTRLAHVTARYNKIDTQVLTLAKAWHITRRDEFAAEVYRILEAYADVYPGLQRHDRWGRKGMLAAIGGKRFCQSLIEATNVIKLAAAYDLVYDWKGVDKKIRRKIESDFFEATVNCIYRFYLVNSGRNNHMTWYNGGVATTGAVLGRADWLDKAIDGRKGLLYQFDTSVTDEGLWYEGTFAYHYYALQAVIATVRAATACSRDLTQHPPLKKMFLGPLYFQYPNGQMPAINDGDRTNIRGYRGTYAFAADTWKDRELKTFLDKGEVEGLRSEVYDDAGLVYLRRGAGPKSVTAVMDFGQHGGGHGHPDKMNMMLYALGQEIFLDPGRLTYRCPEHTTWARQTVAHNTVVVDKKSQSPAKGKIVFFERHNNWDAAVAECDSAYRGTSLRRALVLFDEVLVDLLAVDTAKRSAVDWVLHGQAKLTTPDGLLKPWKGQLHDDAGYQHLTDLSAGVAKNNFVFDWLVGEGRFVRTHLLLNGKSNVFSGNGIGYALSAKVPFVILRRNGTTTFVAVHDLSGDASAVRDERCDAGEKEIVLSLQIRGGPTEIRWRPDAAKKPLIVVTAADTKR